MFLYLCCTAHHTFYTSEHRFLPLRKYQHYMSERRSRGLSPRSCLEKKRCKGDWNTRGMLWGPDKHFNTCKKKGVWAFGTLRKVQALTTSSHKHHLKVDEHTVLLPFHREGSGHKRITQHSSLDGLKKYRNGTIRKEKQASVEKTMITGLEREC